MSPIGYAAHLQPILDSLPETPGVYQYFDKEGTILYVGKAKNLRNRVSSYFRDTVSSPKTRALVKKIWDIKLIHVDSEYEALLLENNLIKQYQPHYNILLKDDKSYPWITITGEPFPRIYQVHRKRNDGNLYFGPYPSGKIIRELMTTVRNLFQYRTCRLPLSEKSIAEGKYKACMNYQIKLCNAPCEGRESRAEYAQTIEEIKSILKGNFSEILQQMRKKMMLHAEKLEFEQAQVLKLKIQSLENYTTKWTVVSNSIKNVEVYSFEADDIHFYVNRLQVLEGAVVNAYSTEVLRKLNETNEEMFANAILRLRDVFESEATEIIVPFKADIPEEYVKQTTPKTGDRKKLLELSQRNVKFYRFEKLKQAALVDPERHSNRILETLKKDLRLHRLPRRIDCFDNSNIQGAFPVASMVCFIDAKPAKKEYRHFNIKTVEGPNDYASMEEIIHRRYKRVLEEGAELPQLIVVDGGKGQITAAVKSLKALNIYDKIALIGLAERLEEIYFPKDPYPLYLNKDSESLKLLQQLRNEAHRFAITHHRNKRSKNTIKSVLTDIPGIGKSTAEKLLLKFSSVKQIKQATLPQMETCIGLSKAKIVWNYFHTGNPV